MAKGKAHTAPAAKSGNDGRKNGKASKKHPKIFDKIKRRLVTN